MFPPTPDKAVVASGRRRQWIVPRGTGKVGTQWSAGNQEAVERVDGVARRFLVGEVGERDTLASQQPRLACQRRKLQQQLMQEVSTHLPRQAADEDGARRRCRCCQLVLPRFHTL